MGRFLNYLLVPIYAAAMSAASGGYGVVTEVYAWTALLMVILTYGMETTFFRFVNKETENSELILGEEVKYYKCIISKFNEDHLIFQYRDITGRSVVRLKLEKKINDLREVEKAAHIGLWTFDSLTRIFTYSGYTQVFCENEVEKSITFD